MVISILEAGLILCLTLSLIALAVAFYSLTRIRKQAEANEKLYQRMLRDIAIANTGSVGMGQRLLAMEKRLQSEAQKPRIADDTPDDEFQPYTQAAQLFKMGLGSEEVARRCGLSRAEASLMEMMQKASR
ncbi:DUF2802 domain-containing protein [Cellvibrio sp. ARAG 10.3]|jgi:Flp pilus assembly protein TadB|uniref:DUF2802 domain-containing protein n=1 Tax=Cellvibrio sp. ARAG 10.3 TaxID=3451358 RepID=UPI002D05C53F|nr:DUF2802 domain-containing protein [Cellvibrio sp.]